MHFSKATERITRPGRSLFLPSRFRSFSLHDSLPVYVIILLFLSFVSKTSLAQSIMLESDQAISTAGYYQLSWELEDAPAGTVYVVDERSTETSLARPVYQGEDTAIVFSGKPDGNYIYSVRSNDNLHTSNTIEVTVQHHSLSTAFKFFWLGAIVFVVLFSAIILGNKQTAKE